MKTIGSLMGQLEGYWKGPSFTSYDQVHHWFQRTANDLHEVMDEIVRRMKVSHDNFHKAEVANLANLQKGNGG